VGESDPTAIGHSQNQLSEKAPRQTGNWPDGRKTCGVPLFRNVSLFIYSFRKVIGNHVLKSAGKVRVVMKWLKGK
jgi:hypothetical protein